VGKFKSVEELLGMEFEDVVEYFEEAEVSNEEEAWELSLLKWDYIRKYIQMGNHNYGVSIGALDYKLADRWTTCGLCKLAIDGEDFYCEHCLIGREGYVCFKEFEVWRKCRDYTSASAVYERILEEYRRWKSSAEDEERIASVLADGLRCVGKVDEVINALKKALKIATGRCDDGGEDNDNS